MVPMDSEELEALIALQTSFFNLWECNYNLLVYGLYGLTEDVHAVLRGYRELQTQHEPLDLSCRGRGNKRGRKPKSTLPNGNVHNDIGSMPPPAKRRVGPRASVPNDSAKDVPHVTGQKSNEVGSGSDALDLPKMQFQIVQCDTRTNDKVKLVCKLNGRTYSGVVSANNKAKKKSKAKVSAGAKGKTQLASAKKLSMSKAGNGPPLEADMELPSTSKGISQSAASQQRHN